jgi:hypothetical protein
MVTRSLDRVLNTLTPEAEDFLLRMKRSLSGGDGFALLVDSGGKTKALVLAINDRSLERRGDYSDGTIQELRDEELITTHAFVADMPEYAGRKLKDKSTGSHVRLSPLGQRVVGQLSQTGTRNDG